MDKEKKFNIALYEEELIHFQSRLLSHSYAFFEIEEYLIRKLSVNSLKLKEIIINPPSFGVVARIIITDERELVLFWLTCGNRIL